MHRPASIRSTLPPLPPLPPVRRPSAARRAGAVLRALACAALLGSAVPVVVAGQQQYEPLADSVRTALAASLGADGASSLRPHYDSAAHRDDWLQQMAARLPARWMPDPALRIEFLEAVRYEAQRAGLDPELVLGLIQVESNFRRYAISTAGARGLMQVMPFWSRLLGDGDDATLFDMRTNLRYGCTILRHYLDIERGNLFRALGRYNGSLGRAPYPEAVRRAWDRWRYRPSEAAPATLAAAGG